MKNLTLESLLNAIPLKTIENKLKVKVKDAIEQCFFDQKSILSFMTGGLLVFVLMVFLFTLIIVNER